MNGECEPSKIEIGNFFTDEESFNHVLLHELAHVIWVCQTNEKSYKSDHQDTYPEEEATSGYSERSCSQDKAVPEDYAEMLSYYLMIPVKEQKIPPSKPCPNPKFPDNPYSKNRLPLREDLAKMILGEL